MKRQAIVVGLGQFGMSVARALANRGVEILAVDINPDRVRTASSFVAEAARFDATDAEAIARTAPERRDVCICAIGDEAREASIICTALLRQMGAERVIARANDDVHARILTLVGAHQVVNPEREFGERFANQILHEEIKGEMSLGEGILITEIEIPDAFVGKSLADLRLRHRYGITVVAVRKGESGPIILPDPNQVFSADDYLVVVSAEGAVAKLMERN